MTSMFPPSPKELAEEARKALEESRMTPQEHIEFLIREGIIDSNGRVLVNKHFGDPPTPATNAETSTPPDRGT